MRGPLWLAWLSLMCALQLAAGDAGGAPDSEDLRDRPALHLAARTRSLPGAAVAAARAIGGNQDELAASPAVAIAAVPHLPAIRRIACRRDTAVPDAGPSRAGLNPRAPPASPLL